MIDHGRTESQDLGPKTYFSIFENLSPHPKSIWHPSTTSLIFIEHIKHKTNDTHTQASGFVLFLLRRGPVSRHTSTKTRLSSYEIHATPQRLIKQRAKQNNQRSPALIPHPRYPQRWDSKEEQNWLEKNKQTNSSETFKKKNIKSLSILCLHRVFWCSIFVKFYRNVTCRFYGAP